VTEVLATGEGEEFEIPVIVITPVLSTVIGKAAED